MIKYLFLAISVFLLISCEEERPQIKILQGNAFGTTYGIQYFSDAAMDAEKGIDSVIYRVNKSVSTYLPKSDISRINEGDSTIVVDAIFKEVFRISETVYTNSNGYFDPTVGVLRNAYGFGDNQPLEVIDSTTLDSLRQFVGFRKVQLKADGTIHKEHSEIYFDFNAVAKGYGIDLIGAYLDSLGIDNYIIELGGELLAKGINLTKGTPWLAGVEAIDSELSDRSASAIVSLRDCGMAASGNYRKFRIDTQTGQKYVHTINPLTGLAQQNDVTSATIIAPSCALADAYATACMAMGLERSVAMLSSVSNIDAYLTYLDENGASQVYVSDGFQKLLVE